jgi:hypothetical protein
MTDTPTPIDGRRMAKDTSTRPRQTSSYRSAVTARPEARLNGNGAVGRRVRDLYQALMVRLNEPTDVVIQADILAWAELKAASEVARARLLDGDTKSSNEVVRLENLTRRAAGTVGLEPSASASEQSDPYGYAALLVDDDDDALESAK